MERKRMRSVLWRGRRKVHLDYCSALWRASLPGDLYSASALSVLQCSPPWVQTGAWGDRCGWRSEEEAGENVELTRTSCMKL